MCSGRPAEISYLEVDRLIGQLICGIFFNEPALADCAANQADQ